jgi:rhodanese-related sulfurtransferase
MLTLKQVSAALGGIGLALASTFASAGHITPDLTSVEVMHKGKEVLITRAESDDAVIPDAYLKVGRHCPPFCIQPMHIAPGVETVGELEVLHYLDTAQASDPNYIGTPPVLVVDSRTPEWIARGTIPGSVNIPWTTISVDIAGGFPVGEELGPFYETLINQFGVLKVGDHWDFSKAKTLVLFCNGIWCPQSATNINTLLRLGYPADKLKWYRGGMQDWVTAGLTTVNE